MSKSERSPEPTAQGPEPVRPLSIPARITLGLLRAYKILLSPLFTGACRFTPSCSDYAAEAVTRHGVLRGGWLGVVRLARCHPFGGHGADPVPDRLRAQGSGPCLAQVLGQTRP